MIRVVRQAPDDVRFALLNRRAADRMRGIASTIRPVETALRSYDSPQAKNTRLRAKFLSKIKGRFSAQKFGRSTSSAVIDAPTISPSTPRSWGRNARSPHDADHPGRSRALAARPDRVRSRGLDRSRNGPALRKAQGPRRRGALPAGPFFMDGKFIISPGH
jgi:hypothetical protein